MKNRYRLSLFVIAFICLFSTKLWAQLQPTDIRLDTDLQSNPSTFPQVSTDNSGNVYTVWKDDRAGINTANIYFNRSTNSGVSWMPLDLALGYTGGPSFNGQIAIRNDNAGHVYVIWIQAGSNLKINRSADYGQTWITNQANNGSGSGNSIANFDVDLDDNGHICVVWEGTNAGGLAEIWSNCSSDYGATWMANATKVNTTPPYPYDTQQTPTMCLSKATGRLHVTWTDNRGSSSGGDRYVYYTYSNNYAASWQTDQNLYGNPVNGVDTRTPQIACDDNNHVYIAWRRNQYGLNNNFQLWVNRSSDGGLTWAGNQFISFFADSPRIKADNQGVYLLWETLVNNPYKKLKFQRSIDFGATWQSAVQVTNSHDVEQTSFNMFKRGNKIYVVWEDNSPWQGIYLNYSTNNGATWKSQDVRVDNNPGTSITTDHPAISVDNNDQAYIVWEDGRNGSNPDIYLNYGIFSNLPDILREADYIASCQYLNPGNAADGAINNVWGSPTWVVPRENALGILALHKAYQLTGNINYLNKANLAMNYLVSVQDPTDGAWYDQYNFTSPVVMSKSPTQTAEVMLAMYRLGYDSNRYTAMKKGAQYLLQNQVNGFGGLLSGGKNAAGQFSTLNWTSDNSWAYWALIAARGWAASAHDYVFGNQLSLAAANVLNGINLYLRNAPVWHQAINNQGVISNPATYDWINYAPQMLDVPVNGLNDPLVGNWIQTTFQQANGAMIGPITNQAYPGLAFQASLAWLDLGQNDFATKSIGWAETSGLWQLSYDPNGAIGGWVDWLDINSPAMTANWWERFIDTSFYSISTWIGGYDFSFPKNAPPKIAPVPMQIVPVGTTLTLVLVSGDRDGDPLTFSATNMPPGATFNPLTQTFIFTPTIPTKKYLVHFEVSDGLLINYIDVAIRVP